MTFSDEQSLYAFIAKVMLGEEIDFVAGPVISHWHAIGVDALVYDISQNKKGEPSGIIIVTAHPSASGFLITEADFSCRNFAIVKFCFIDYVLIAQRPIVYKGFQLLKKTMNTTLAVRNVRRQDSKERKKIYLASIFHPNVFLLQPLRNLHLARKYYPIFALIDEGVGTYMPGRVWRLNRKFAAQRKYPEHLSVIQLLRVEVISAIGKIAVKLLTIIATRYVNIENRFLFTLEENKLIVNKAISNCYRLIIDKGKKVSREAKSAKPVAIILTQPFSEEGQILLGQEISLVKAVIHILIETGFDVVVKPHPRETIGKYAAVLAEFEDGPVKLIQQKMPVENLFAELPLACVIGYTSTALLTAKVLYNIPAIAIIDILTNHGENNLIRTQKDYFKKLAKEMVYDIKALPDLENVLYAIKADGK